MSQIKKRRPVRANSVLDAIYESVLDPSQLVSLPGRVLQYVQQPEQEQGESSESMRSLSRLSAIAAHFKQAFRLGVAQDRLKFEHKQLNNVVQAVLPAVYVVDAHAKVKSMNERARAFLGEQRNLTLLDQQLDLQGLSSLSESSLLKQALDDARETGLTVIDSPVETCQNPVMQGSRFYIRCLDSEEPYFAVVVFNQKAMVRSVKEFGRRHRLSPKECQVIEKVMWQLPTKAIADQQGVSYHTLRQHLQAIYSKTRLSSQTKLVAAVLKQTLFTAAAGQTSLAALPHIAGLAYSRNILLQDGRQLCYADFGDPEGIPLLYFSSMNMSRLELILLRKDLSALGIRLISVDGPGHGRSDLGPERTFTEYADDIAQLLDALQLDCVDVMSRSAGAPFALALASVYPDRVRQVVGVGGMPPFEIMGEHKSRMGVLSVINSLQMRAPMLVQPMLEFILNRVPPEDFFRYLTENNSNIYSICETDRQYVTHPDHIDYFVMLYVDSFRQGSAALIRSILMLNRNWDIAYENIRCPVHFWHGSEDVLFGEATMRAFVSQLPNGRMSVLEGGTHYMLFLHLETFLQDIVN